ncbi:MAG: gamma-glutamyltransferase, partial [Myxococcota bacterium]|nr:gamma-glutamyltransferase [Myxococcota bacterium]
ALRSLFAPNGTRLREGDTFVFPALADTLDEFASSGSRYFRDGPGTQAFLETLHGKSRITALDFQSQRVIFRPALAATYRDATLWVPGPPSAAGVGVAHTLATLERFGEAADPTGVATVQRLRDALTTAVTMRGRPFLTDMFTEGFGPAFLERVNAYRTGAAPGAGYTTHISTVDGAGNAVAITHSLGETAGMVAGSSGVIVNNFLGETDVNPPFLRRPSGARLITMCCPSILETGDGRIVALGSGGSSRIPTAVVHGAMYLVDHDWTIEEAVAGPRTHVEDDRLHVESTGRTIETMRAVEQHHPAFARFDGPNMFFGGLHAAGIGPDGFSGHGDRRRSGAYGAVD